MIRAIATMITSEILEAMTLAEKMKWDDPRVGSMAIAMLKELRFSGNRSKPFWRPFFVHLPKLKDPRFALLSETLPKTWSVGPSMQKWLANQLEEAATFKLTTAAPPPKDNEKLTALLDLAKSKNAALARSGIGEHAGGTSGETLLADIYANPTDDAARFVYADWLLERGDPRGEFITLQLKKDPDKASLKRERELLKAHKKEWLGRLVNVTGGDLIFRRGFLAEATVKFRHQRDVEQYGSLPEWATLEKLEWGDHLVRDDQLEWSRFIGPSMSHLKIATGPMGKFILAEDGPPWALEDLELWRGDSGIETYHALLKSKRLKNLRVLAASGYAQPIWLENVTECPPELRFHSRLEAETFDEWRKMAGQIGPLVTLCFRYWGGADYRFTRDDRREFTRLALEIRPRYKANTLKPLPPEIGTALSVLRALPAGSLTSFEAKLEIDHEMVDATPLMESVKKLLR
jgi:uncharacterized protein (TIGR02996 family)